ncbi:hypothetical protein LENED_008662 [Lentinula edodes]|uniref:DUF6533 domain-containing protein n=1 Tax=Lentinula edodes TaxID=5353 RepID=A0A1Q3EHL7_LENED|nr:hypothetical protein LENED_008662 [Lentinula edodes]
MSSAAAAAAAEIAALEPTLITIGYDLLSTKVRLKFSSLWSYEYILTLGDEIRYAWKGNKNLLFWLFLLNRYLCLIIIIITNVAYFTPLFTQEVSSTNYDSRVSKAQLKSKIDLMTSDMLPIWISETLVLLRVYALSGRKQYVLFIAIPLIIVQWALLIYQDVLYKDGTSNLGVLLFARELDTSAVPPLPDIDAYRLCIAIPSTQIVKAGETFLSLFIVYDGLAVSSIIYFVSQQAKGFHLVPILELMQRDGLLYFAVMFSSNFVWLMMALHARPSLGFIQNQPAMM